MISNSINIILYKIGINWSILDLPKGKILDAKRN